MPARLGFDLRNQMVHLGNVVHFRLFLRSQAAVLAAAKQFPHAGHSYFRGKERNNFARLRPVGEEGKKLTAQPRSHGTVLSQTQFQDFSKMRPFRFNFPSQLIRQVYRQLHHEQF